MYVKETITAGAIATSIMTAFSYAASAAERENFKEPALLSGFLQNLTASNDPVVRVSGWPVHYTLGCVWAFVYTFWTEREQGKASLKQALAFGVFSGLVGILVWREMFRRLPHPKTNYLKFYRQLFLAHLVFALSLRVAYPLLKRKLSA